MPFTLDGITLHPTDVEEFEYAQTTVVTTLLSDGTSVDNDVLQQGSQPSPQARLKGLLSDSYDIEELRALYLSKEAVTFNDPVLGTRTVRVLDFSAMRSTPFLWKYDMTLIGVAGGGSGS